MGCLYSVRPRLVEVIALVFTIIGICFYIWGIADIPWDDISKGGKAFYAIGGICQVLVFLIILVLMCLRIGNKINESQNGTGKCLVITLIILEILGLVTVVIGEIIMFINMGDKNDEYYDNNNNWNYRGRRWNSKYSRREWWSTTCSVTAAEIALVIDIICTEYLIKVINAKTSQCYSDYLNQQNTNKYTDSINNINGYTRNINIFNTPPQNNQNYLTFIGYDKDGHPIYSGSNQYYSQNPVPIKATNNNTNENKK